MGRLLILLTTYINAFAGGPGNYVHYAWPELPTESSATSMEVRHVWTTLPTSKDTIGNAVFASTQQWFESGPGGYMGTQAWLQANGTMAYKAIFSCWDASATVMTSWLPNAPGYCERFGGEGTGSHCLIPITLRQGELYSVRVAFAGGVLVGGVNGAAWAGTITEMSTNVTTPMGTLFHPDFQGHSGYGNFTIAAADFQEYFLSSDCPGQALAGVGLIGPTLTLANGSEVQPVQATSDYVSDCAFSDVTGCIPGVGCGRPGVFMLAGEQTKRTTPKDTPLWK